MKTLQETLQFVKNGGISCEQLAVEILANIRTNDRYNIFLDVFDEESVKRARAIDEKVKDGTAGPLAGCMIAVKDILCIEGKQVTCASRILENYTSPYNATVIEKLLSADAVIVGKTNMDEFAMGSSTENSAFGPVRNPVDPERVPGGSSGGSAAAIAGGFVPVSLGTDTGGSIRQPAAFCGVVGIKPTYGRVSRYGLVAFASSLDQIGPFGQNVFDTALLLETISGYDPKDSTSVDVPVPRYTVELESLDVNAFKKAIRIAVPIAVFGEGLDDEIRTAIMEVVGRLKSGGCTVGEISLPNIPYSVAVYYILANAEASSNLARYDGARYGFRHPNTDDLQEMYTKSRGAGFGDEVKRRIILGTYVLSAGYYEAYYRKAQKVRRLIYNDFAEAFKSYDVVVMPTTPTPPFKLGEKVDNPLEMYLNDIYTIPVNLAGLPALALPCGKTASGLPIGLQLIGRHFEEATILKLGKYIEQRV